MALTAERKTNEVALGGKTLVLPVAAEATIYQGALVALKGGYAVPAEKAANLIAAGRAEETITNSGADGAATITVTRGAFIFDNTATAANKLGAAHVLKPCYIEDDHTVTALATGSSIAGLVVGFEDGGVAVEINPALN